MFEERSNDFTLKALDPYEDPILFNYLKNNKFEAWISRKQVSRVRKESRKYFFKDDEKWLRTNNNVKEKKKRTLITKNIHNIGHFDEEAILAK